MHAADVCALLVCLSTNPLLYESADFPMLHQVLHFDRVFFNSGLCICE